MRFLHSKFAATCSAQIGLNDSTAVIFPRIEQSQWASLLITPNQYCEHIITQQKALRHTPLKSQVYVPVQANKPLVWERH